VVHLARGVVGLLWNVSGPCIWFLFVCCHWVRGFGPFSVVGCLLMANWMSVGMAACAFRLFFFL